MSHHIKFGLLSLSCTVVGVGAAVYAASLLLRKSKKIGLRQVLLSIEFQIVCWDLIRCLTVGLVTGIYNINPGNSHPALCNTLGPFTNMSLRIPFFLAVASILQGRFPRSGMTLLGMGYLTSACFALLPFPFGGEYVHGVQGFCTYYADAYLNVTAIPIQDVMMYDVIIGVVPYLVGFLLLVTVLAASLCIKKYVSRGSVMNALSVLVCYSAMTAIASLILSKVNDPFSLYEIQWLKIAEMWAFVVLPVCVPLSTRVLTLIASCYDRCQGRGSTDELEGVIAESGTPSRKGSSLSTSILISE